MTDPGRVVALQRSAGNAAVQKLVESNGRPPAVAQRAPDPAVTELQNKTRALEKRQASTTQDLQWRGRFGAKLSSWKQAVYRVSGGIDAARSGFTTAQGKQAEFDALVTQLVMAGATVGFAAGFEPLLSATLMATKIGGATANAEAKIKAVAAIVEKIENPAVSAVSAQANIVGALPKQDPSPGAGLAGSTAVGYLSGQLETLEALSQRIERAFADRAGEVSRLSDVAAATLDTQKQEGIYAGIMTDLDAAAAGVEKMKPAATVATVIERHAWAGWLKTKYLPATRGELGYSSAEFDDFGSYTEDRLNAIGVAGLAGVELTGHWYRGNSAGYVDKLLAWARSYQGSITQGGAD